MPDVLVWPGLVLLGIAVGAYGTIIGAGGGFIVTPVLIILYPQYPPEVIAALSLGVVFFNAVSGSVAYSRQHRIDYVAAGLFGLATLPGAIAGAFATSLFPRHAFEIAFGLLLFMVAIWLLAPHPGRMITTVPPRRYLRRLLTDASGDTYSYAFDPILGMAIGLVIGFIASLFGVGGGIIYVPVMVLLLRFPAHIAVATSTLALVITSGAGASVHLAAGHYTGAIDLEVALAVGMVVGAQIGALISVRLAHHQLVVQRMAALALLGVAARLVLGGLL